MTKTQDIRKRTIVINGRGGVGKDTLCDVAAKRYRVRNISSITPIKEIARQNGWNGEKDLRSRRFLSELKRVFTEYNDLPTVYLLKQFHDFLLTDEQILFVHIREPEQIAHFVSSVGGQCLTLLVRRRDDSLAGAYGNHSDDDVESYPYDYIFDNSAPLQQSAQNFLSLIDLIFEDSKIDEKNDDTK